MDITIYRGEFVSIVGESGSGKSTLMNIIGALDRPTSGEYTLNGIDMFRFLRSSQWKELYERSEDTMRVNFPDWKKNKYLKNLNAKNRFFLNCFNAKTAWLFKAAIR